MKPHKPHKPHTVYRFLLYVADDTHNSTVAIANLKAFCRKHLPDRHEIEVVGVFKHPNRALADRVFMTPVLIRRAPVPQCRVIGTLSQPDRILQGLNLEPDGT